MKNFNLIEMLQGCSKRNGTAVYASNPDGQPTVKRQSRLMSHQGKAFRNVQMSSTCPRFVLVLPSFCSRLDSLSLVSRQSDSGNVCGISALFSTRVWKHVAMIFAVLVMSMANIGMAWAGTETITWAGTSLTGVSSANITAGTATAVNGDTWKAGTISISSSKIQTESKKHTNDTYWEDFSAAAQQVEGGVSATGTARIELPFTVGEGYTFTITDVGYKMEQGGGGGPAVHAFIVQGSTATWLNYTTANTISLTGKSIALSAGSAKLVFVLGVTSNFTNGRQFKFSGISIKGTVAAAASGVTNPSFSPATGSSLVKSTGTVTLTSSGNTVYYKWSQTDNQYASGAGATLAGAADGSGPSPVNATAPSTAGTWYLYAVAKNGGDYSNVVKATYTITNPTHTLTWNLDGGTATGGTAAGAVAEGATLTAPTVTKVGYDFAGWSPAVPATMPAADATYTATWTKVYASGTYNFYNNATLGTSPNQKTITTSYADYDAFRIDNIFFSAVNMAYESGSTATGSDYAGWKIKKNNATIKFFVENDSEVTISVGRDNTLNVSYTNTAGASQTPTISSGNSSTYSVKGGTMVTLTMSTSSTITIKQIAIAPIASCTAPSSVGITGTNKYLGGQTISLTATPVGGSGTATYQWQKEINSVWTNVTNGDNISGATTNNLQITGCTHQNSGQYRCIVSTGATCSTTSSAYGVHVFSIYGKYYSGEYSHNEITWTSGTTGTATIHLNASSTYLFKVWSNDGYYYGNGSNNYIIQPVNWDCGTGNDEMRLLTGPEGDYTFTVNIEHGLDGSPYVNLQVGYPSVSHPSTGYMYITKWWDHCYVHYWEGTNNDLSPWGYDPEINSDRYVNICGTNYWYFPVIDTYNKVIAKDAAGDPSNTTGDQVSTDHGGKYITHDGSWGWHEFSTYTITYTGNGGGGSMSATSGICPDADQAIISNAFTAPTGCASFAHWTANVNVKVGGNTITAGDPIANGATIQNINSNITLTAVWKLAIPTITDNGDNTFSISGSMAGSSYYYTTNNSTPTTSSSLYSSAVDFSAGEADITAKAIAHKDGYVDSDVASQACTYHAPAVACYEFDIATSGSAPSVGDAVLGTGDAGMTVAGLNTSGSMTYNSYGIKFNASGDKLRVVLPNNMKEGTVISIKQYSTGNGSNRGITLKNSSDANVTDIIWNPSGSAEENTITYTVTSSDGLKNTNTFYLVRKTNSYLKNVTVSNCGDAACTTPTTAFANGAYTVGGSALDLSTLISSKQGSGAITYTVKNANGTGATIAGTSFTATSAGAATVTATQAADGDYCEKVMDATITVSAAPAGQTALVINTLYEVPDMIPSGASLTSGDQFFDGLSANTKFELIGSASGSTTPKVNNNSSNDKTIDGITFDDGSMWFKGNASLTSNIPTTFGLSFIVPEGGGKLYLYFSGTSTNIKLAKSGETGSKPSCASGYGEVDVTAGTYYLYGTGTTAPYCFYGLKLCSTYSVSITPTNVTKETGATGASAAVYGKAYTATFTANTGYTLPSDATVSIGGVPQTKGTGYTWTISDGTATLTIPAANVTGAISITVTGVAAESYSITYHCNGAEIGCPSNVAATTNLPSPLPTGMTKDGYDFGGWFTDSECTVAAVAGAALTGNTDLYAKWTERGSGCEDTPHAWNVIATSAKSYKVRISKVTEDVAIPVADATASNLTAYAGTSSTSDNVTVQIADGGSSKYGYKFDGSNTYLKLVFSTPLVLNDTLVVGMTNASHNISFTTTAVRSTTLSTSGGKLIIPAALAGQSTLYLWRGSGTTMYLRSFAVKHECEAIPSCTTPTLPTATLSNQTVCEGSDIAAWDATPTNASTITGKSESISYSWKKKGNDTELATTATFDLGASAAESQAGTYVVTVTVSKAGYASSSANKEVDLTVTEGEEVTSITADKATVYPGNSVTLTATANITPDSWQWYTCTSAEGAGAVIISGAESASYTIASAGVAGTYYYKAVATGDCGTAEAVYTLVVSPAAGGDCFHFVSVIPASDFNASSGASLVTPTHATTLEGGTMKVGSQQVTFTKDYGLKMEGTKTVSITLDAALEAGNVVIVKGTSGSKGYGITINGVNFYDADSKTFDVSYTVLADDGLVGKTALTVSKYSGNSYLQEVKITGCGESCTDPEVTASADNTTACVGTSVTFTATGAHAEATYQWQKLNGTWTNISGATESTYTITSVVAGDAGKYRVIASNDCNRTSNEVTLSVPSVPDFGSTVPSSVSVMQTIALSINTVEATDAVKYRWYKSADATWDAGDVEIGTNKELIKAYDGEAIGTPSYYIFCRAQNACGITTSTAIAVNVTTYVEEDCATRGNESDAAFSFENSGCGQGSYQSTACWTMNSNSKILVYYPPTGKYFKTAKVTIASSSENKASYNWSTNGGTSFTAVSLTVNSTLTEHTIDLSAHGNVDAFQIGRNFDSKGSSSGTLYVSKICFEYTDACTATKVTPSTESTSYEMGGVWSNPTFTLAPAAVSGETLTYSSSNEDIASVDDDGTVTFNGDAGTVTITASYAGGEVSSTQYCASEGSYTITVSCPGGAPKVVADGSTDMVGCNTSVTLLAKKQDDTAFADGTYQWFRNGEEIDGATSSSYTATQAGTYTVERTNTSGCTTPSTNSAVVTSETTEPEVERLVPFQYYHVDSIYRETSIMRFRHLFAVKNSGKLDGKSFKMYVSRNGTAATDVTSSNALVVVPNGDGHVDTVMVDLNKLSGKYSKDDELVYTCKAIDCSGNVSDVYKETITMNVIDETPTLALICSGSSKAGGTRKTGELTVGGDFLTGYNVADLCQQTGNTSFDANTEWGLYTDLKTQYIVTPVNGYAVFNKLNYEPFDILLLTDYPKASKSDAAKDVLDDMAALCDYRPMLSFKTHMVAKSPSKWAEKGFTTSPVVTKADGKLNLNIVCYAHPMFESLKTGEDVYTDVGNTSAPLVYTMLSGAGYESSKGMQGFELAAAENFVTIGLTHYNATIAKNSPLAGEVEWTPGSEDRMLVTVAERQANPEARFILFSLNCGAQSKLTDKGEEVILACLNYLLGTAEGTIEPADCSFTFDNGENNEHDDAWYEDPSHCDGCTGTKGDGKWTTAANWGPDYRLLPGEFTSVRIKKPVEVDDTHAHVMEVRIIDEGRIDIPAGKALDVKSTIRRQDGTEIYPTEIGDIHIGSASTGNGTLIFNNDDGDTKARVDMYSKGFIDGEGVKNYQYIGTPFLEINALYNYYGSWIYYWKADGSGWKAVKNGGPMTAWTGYCITQETPTYHQMSGTLAATGTVDINVPADANMVVGNSWTAPIDINALTTDDLEGLTANIYFFNTGVDKEGTAGAAGSRYAGGTYVTIPVEAARYEGEDDHINSLQGFFVKNTGGSAGTLHLDYEKHVRGTTRGSIIGDALHAPARRANAQSDEPVVLKMKVSGENYDDKLLLLEREDFTEGFDNGWDGDKWDGNESALYIYTTDSEGTENSVSAIPQLEGTVIGFRAGEDDAYTLNFEYLNSEEPLYLYDVETNMYTQLMTGTTYRFFTTDNEKHDRFILTRKNPQVATGVGEVPSDQVLSTKAKKLLIEDKMFIMVNGMLYDATGKVVK